MTCGSIISLYRLSVRIFKAWVNTSIVIQCMDAFHGSHPTVKCGINLIGSIGLTVVFAMRLKVKCRDFSQKICLLEKSSSNRKKK